MNGQSQPSSSRRQLCERILSWLSNVSPSYPPAEDSLAPEDALSSPTESFYQGSSSPSSSGSSSKSDLRNFLPAVSPEVSCYAMDLDSEEDVSLYRYRSDIYGNVPEFSMFYARNPLGNLPDPLSNPLITLSPEVIEEEYSRVLEVRNTLQTNHDDLLRQQRLQIKQQSYEVYDWTIEQQLFEASLAIQKANSAAEYIMDFCFHHNIHIDFLTLSLCHFRPPTQQLLPAVEIYDASKPFAPDASIYDQSHVYGHGAEGLQHQMVDWVY